jgi:hypothetical protein
MGFELTTLVVIDNDCIGSWKSNYHTITTTTVTPRIILIEKLKCHSLINITNPNNTHQSFNKLQYPTLYLPAARIQPHVLMKKTWKWFVKVFWESEKWRLSPPYADNLMYVWNGLNLKIEGYSPTTLCACTKLGSLDFHGFLSLFALVCWVLKFVEGLVRVVRIG